MAVYPIALSDEDYAFDWDATPSVPDAPTRLEPFASIDQGQVAGPYVPLPWDLASIVQQQRIQPDAFAPLIPLAKQFGVTPQTVMDALDYLSAASPDIGQQEAEDLLLGKQRPPDALAKVVAGAQQSLLRGAEGMTSVPMLATMGGAGALPQLGQRIVSGAFGAHMLSQAPAAAERLAEAVVSGDPEQIAGAATDFGQLGAFTAAAGTHAAAPRPQVFSRSLRELAATPEKPQVAAVEKAPVEPISAGADIGTVPPTESPARKPESVPAQLPAEPKGIAASVRVPGALQGAESGAVSLAPVKEMVDKISNTFATRGNKRIAAATRDAADNQSLVRGDQYGNGMTLEAKKAFGDDATKALDAVVAVIESGGDRAKLQDFIAQTQGKPGAEGARAAAEFAEAHWDEMQPLAERFRTDTAEQRAMEEAAGIKVEERQNYFPHLFDVTKLPGKGAEFFGTQGGGGGGKFRAQRTFNTIYDAIEAGYGPAIKTLNASEVLRARVGGGTQRVMNKAWVDSLRNLNDPTTSTPIVGDVTIDPNGVMLAPAGYEVKSVLNGPPVAVHQGYAKLMDALTGTSQVANFEVMGLPVGEALLKGEASIKHGMLLFDTFHASRMMQKAAFLSPSEFGPQLLNPKRFGKKGVSLLEYADRDLAEAVAQGEISPEIAKYVKANRADADLLLRRGLNVGQIQESLRSGIIKNIPLLGKYLKGFNDWVFKKVTRGAMMQGALIEFERIQKANPSWSREKVADKVSKDLNAYFGNLGRQGVFKSKTFQDLSRLILLAPNWFESMARSEVYGYGQLGKAAVDTARGQPKVGSVGKGMANGLLAYFIGTQVLNLITRGKPTWENEEEDHKMDAWIPDATGKSPGFFMSPMSVPAEITHDFFRYRSKKHDDSAESAFQIAKNKMSPMARAVYVMATGDTYKGKVNGTWNRAKQAAFSLVPVPIAGGGFFSDRPGQAQRQLTASAGFKTEPAETPLQQMRTIHSRWLANNPDPKVRSDYEQNLSASFPVSKYRDLDRALDSGDRVKILEAIEELRPLVKKDADIKQRMRPFIGEGIHSATKPLLHESAAMERKFLDTLTDKQRELYDRAIEDRRERWLLFLDVWPERGDRPEKPE